MKEETARAAAEGSRADRSAQGCSADLEEFIQKPQETPSRFHNSTELPTVLMPGKLLSSQPGRAWRG